MGFDLAKAGSPVIMFVGNAVGTFVALYPFKLVMAVVSPVR